MFRERRWKKGVNQVVRPPAAGLDRSGTPSRAFLPPIPSIKKEQRAAYVAYAHAIMPFVLISHGIILFELHLRYCLRNTYRAKLNEIHLLRALRESWRNFLFPDQGMLCRRKIGSSESTKGEENCCAAI